MIVTGDWVVPVRGRPIPGGAVLTRGPRIEMVGPLESVVAAAPDDTVETFGGHVLMPGLVNAHTHLSLTVLSGLIPPMPLRQFLERVTSAVLCLTDDDFAASATWGALRSLSCGVTCVGDMAYGPEPLASCADVGVGGVFYWEVLGLDAADLSGELAEREFPADVGTCSVGRTRCGISPHTPYTSGPELLRATWNIAHRHGVGFALHVAESAAEQDLMHRGAGLLRETADRLAHGFRPPGVGSVEYLEGLGVLDGAVAVHCVHLEPGDAARLAAHAQGVVVCPRSNRHLGNGDAPVAELSSVGVPMALGTDSAASNEDLDLFEEARAAHRLDPTLTPGRMLAMLTSEGAEVLGLSGMCGALAPGLQADIAIVRTGATEDPVGALLREGGAAAMTGVVSSGIWRVRDGNPARSTASVERAAARARAAAERALA